MSTNCNICQSKDITNIYQFSDRAITSICSEKKQNSNVHFCNYCTHVLTDPLEDIDHFYAETYDINMGSEEEDQLLKIVDGEKIYRYSYQADTMIKKLELNAKTNYKILDFGAAKASTLRKIHEKFPNINPYVYDVSDKYKHFWDNFIKKDAQFIKVIDKKFQASFDVVCSFFMLEHVAEPVEILKTQYSLLKDGGIVYFVIPNLYKNTADLLVLDHINHFSQNSLLYMMEKLGFMNIVIDEQINDGWFVVTAVKKEANRKLITSHDSPIHKAEIAQLFLQAKGIADYWNKAFIQVSNFDISENFAIYGAGFYGSYIALNLKPHLKASYFVDQNKFLQGKTIHDVKVVSPHNLPKDIKRVLVGINPLVAEEAINSVSDWKDRDIKFDYLFKQ